MWGKDTVNEISIRLDIAEIGGWGKSEHENTAIETAQNSTNCENDWGKTNKQEYSISELRTTSCDQIHVTGVHKERRGWGNQQNIWRKNGQNLSKFMKTFIVL